MLCDSKPGAAGLRGFPVPPRSRRISLYCSSPQQSSWRPESYPGWEKTEERWTGLTLESINCFITSLTGHLLVIFSSNTPYRLMLACSDLSLVTQIRMFGATWSNFKLIVGADRMSVCAGVEIFFAGARQLEKSEYSLSLGWHANLFRLRKSCHKSPAVIICTLFHTKMNANRWSLSLQC